MNQLLQQNFLIALWTLSWSHLVETILQEGLARPCKNCKKGSFSLAFCRILAESCKKVCKIKKLTFCKILQESYKMQEKRTFSCDSCKTFLQDGFYWALAAKDDIAAYLVTFDRIMSAYKMQEESMALSPGATVNRKSSVSICSYVIHRS